MKLAAIDVGSNAVRLLLSRVYETDNGPYFKKISLIRMPIRLGDDAFRDGRISAAKMESLCDAFIGFKYLIKSYGPEAYLACATSAMREASNGSELVRRICESSGINLEIIDGEREAHIIYSNHIAEYLQRGKAYLYVDVGGGSTELTLFHQDRVVDSRSLNIGTVRLLEGLVEDRQWQDMKHWLNEKKKEFAEAAAIGSGGNINKMHRMLNIKTGKPVLLSQLKKLRKHLESYSVKQRITELGLRPDRADVIVPAAQIYTSAMKWAGIREMYVPQVGLADGLIAELYEKQRAGKTEKD